MDFTESFTIEIPQLKEEEFNRAVEFYSTDSATRCLVVEIAAIHAGVTANYREYPLVELERAVKSWYTPYNKPIIKNHDMLEEPLGRVTAAKMAQEEDGSYYIEIQAVITDKEAIEKILSKRYLTGSVGGKVSEARCSICSTDWADRSNWKRSAPCAHTPGEFHKGKLVTHRVANIEFKEYSWVNGPADERSTIRSHQEEEEGLHEVTAAAESHVKMFGVDISESAKQVIDFFEDEDGDTAFEEFFSSRQFLSAFSPTNEKRKESEVDEEELLTTQDEDILAVTEGLSNDLAEAAEEEVEAVEEAEETDEVVEDEDSPEAVEAEEEEVESVTEDEAEEVEEEVVAEETSVEEEETVAEEEAEIAELNEDDVEEEDSAADVEALELQIQALTSERDALRDENAQLKTALKRGLAERVVDAKISLGVASEEDRADLLEEHVKRSAASLADSLRDFAKLTPLTGAEEEAVTTAPKEVPEMDVTSGAVVEENVITDGTPDEVKEDNEIDPENLFTDVLLGRRTL